MSPRPIAFTPRRAVIATIVVAACILLGYTLWVALPLIEGPSLEAHNEVQGGETGVVRIWGSTKRVSFLSLDGAPITISEDGSFSVYRAYPPGYTAITLAAGDRFGRTRIQKIETIITYGTKKED